MPKNCQKWNGSIFRAKPRDFRVPYGWMGWRIYVRLDWRRDPEHPEGMVHPLYIPYFLLDKSLKCMQETLNLGETPFSSGREVFLVPRFQWSTPVKASELWRKRGVGTAGEPLPSTATCKRHTLKLRDPITWTLVCHGASPSSIVMVGLHSCSREALLTLLWNVTTFGLYGFWRVSEGLYAILEILSTSFYIYVGMVWVFKHVQLSLAFGSQKFGCQISDSRDCLRGRKRCPPPISTPQVLDFEMNRSSATSFH